MPESPSILTPEEIAFLRALVRHRVPFLVVGLAAAALQGAPAVTQDVDLWIGDLHDPRFRRALAAVGAAFVPSVGPNPPMLAGPGVALFDLVLRMDGLGGFAREARRAVPIAIARGLTIPVLPRARIIASKRAADRSKDRLVLPVLEDALAVSQPAPAPPSAARSRGRLSPVRPRRKIPATGMAGARARSTAPCRRVPSRVRGASECRSPERNRAA